MAFKLKTKIDKTIVNSDMSTSTIPAGSEGRVIDILIEDGKAKFVLEFKNEDYPIEQYEPAEIEDKF